MTVTKTSPTGHGCGARRPPVEAAAPRSCSSSCSSGRSPIVVRRSSPAGTPARGAGARADQRATVLLLDEPLGALDLKLREEMQTELKALKRRLGITFVFVTHDQGEALSMADRVAVFNGGSNKSTPHGRVYAPVTPFVAGFVGSANVVVARLARRRTGKRAVCRAAGECLVSCRVGRLPGRRLCGGEWSTSLLSRRHEPLSGEPRKRRSCSPRPSRTSAGHRRFQLSDAREARLGTGDGAADEE